jgi:hypothetical protein
MLVLVSLHVYVSVRPNPPDVILDIVESFQSINIDKLCTLIPCGNEF